MRRGAAPYSGVLYLMGEALYLVVDVLYLVVGVLYRVVGVLYPRRARRCYRTRAGSSAGPGQRVRSLGRERRGSDASADPCAPASARAGARSACLELN